MRRWTFGKRLAASFGLLVALTILKSVVSSYSLHSVVASKDRIITVINEILLDAKDLQILVEERSAVGRAYLLTGDASFLQRNEKLNQETQDVLDRLRGRAGAEHRSILDQLQQANLEYAATLNQLPETRKEAADAKAPAEFFQRTMTR